MRPQFIFIGVLASSFAFACPPALPGTWQRLMSSMAYDGHADPKAVQVCDSMFSTTSKSQCKEKIQRKVFSAGALTYCKSLNVDYAKQECLDSIENSYLSDEALALCQKITSQFERGQCFAQIKDKSFDVSDLEKCGKMSDPNRAPCLAQTGYCIQKTL